MEDARRREREGKMKKMMNQGRKKTSLMSSIKQTGE